MKTSIFGGGYFENRIPFAQLWVNNLAMINHTD